MSGDTGAGGGDGDGEGDVSVVVWMVVVIALMVGVLGGGSVVLGPTEGAILFVMVGLGFVFVRLVR